jgi:hypothetical protein
MLQRSRGFVQRWAYAYREGGIEALKEKPRARTPAAAEQHAGRSAEGEDRCRAHTWRWHLHTSREGCVSPKLSPFRPYEPIRTELNPSDPIAQNGPRNAVFVASTQCGRNNAPPTAESPLSA